MADKATLKLRDVAKRYDDAMLQCRTIGHHWRSLEAAWLQDGNIEQILGCTRCGTQRIQYLDKDGYVLGRRYGYADGYALRGLGRLGAAGRAVFRKAAVLKQLG